MALCLCDARHLPSIALLMLAGCSSVPNKPVPDIASAPTSATVRSNTVRSNYPALPAAGSGRGGYYLDDGPGDAIPDGLEQVSDAVPRVEPLAERGNRPYVVFGTRYVPIVDNQPYKQRGYGSWYGKKFHGQKTSSGELYDMYKMTAASPVLPIPSYARVTNLSNGRQIIVRVNDRGPFRSNRIIDLSYTAALKLGYIGHGSAQLEVERLLPADIEQILAAKADVPSSGAGATGSPPAPAEVGVPSLEVATLAPANNEVIAPTAAAPNAQVINQDALAGGFYLQFGAYSQKGNAESTREELARNLGSGVPRLLVAPAENLYRIYSGPFGSREEAAAAAARMQQSGLGKPFVVQR
jgi:rare lipoprotein A